MTGDGSASKGASGRTRTDHKGVVIRPDEVAEQARPLVLGLLRRSAPELSSAKRERLADLALLAAGEQTTIAGACRATIDAPSERTLQRDLATISLSKLEKALRDDLWKQAKPHLPGKVTIGIDWTEIPYHGKAFDSPEELKRSKAKDGTTWFHTYATLYACARNKRYTLSVRFVRKTDAPTRVLTMFLDELKQRGLRPALVVADKGFATVAAVRALRQKRLAFILPLPLKGKRAKALQNGRSGYWTEYQLGGKKGERVRIAVVVKRNLGEKYHGKKPGNQYFPYIAEGVDGVSPRRVDRLYRQRGGIESSYRMMNQARARTTTRNPAVRLFYFGLSYLLQNAWVRLSWIVSPPKRGRTGRERPKGFFPLIQFLQFLLAWVFQRRGATLTIEQPAPTRRAS